MPVQESTAIVEPATARTRPALDLEQIAEGTDPPAVLAQLLLAIQDENDDAHVRDVRAVEPEASVEGEDETVDYALKRDGRPVMLVECTAATKPLEVPGAPALLQHAEAMDVPLVLFTNGIRFQFYTVDEGEAEPPDGPTLDFDLLGHASGEVDVLRRVARLVFNADDVCVALHGQSRSRQVREHLTQQRDTPDAPLVQFVATQICDENVPGNKPVRLLSVVQHVLDALLGATEDGNKPPAPRAESPVPPGGTEADAQRRTGVFEKDIVRPVSSRRIL